MTKTNIKIKELPFWQLFRLIFVAVSLYLLRDAFHLWDGFMKYATFAEFLPSVALVTVLWTIVVMIVIFLILLPFKIFEWFCLRTGWRVKTEHLIFFLGILILTGVGVWTVKKSMWPDAQTIVLIKLAVFVCVNILTVFITWLFRNKAERWIGIIQERISPLVWLFGIWLIVSILLVAYHVWIKQPENVSLQEVTQSHVPDRKQPNIILVIFDALTVRDMSVYGYYRQTTPFIDEWAKTASVFTRLKAESNYTTPTTASLITGKRVWSHQIYHIRASNPVRSNVESLPLILKHNGYYNMAFIVNTLASVKKLGVSNSFDIAPIGTEFSMPISLLGWDNVKYSAIDILLYRLFGDKIKLHDWIIKRDFVFTRLMRIFSQDFSRTAVPPQKAFNRFLDVIDKNPPEPFFAWIHVFPPHDPYLPPEPFMGMFDSSSEQKTYKNHKKATIKIFDHLEYQNFNQEIQPTVNTLRARYDELVRYCDKQFEEFIEELTKSGKLKNTIIILSSDHGESFEHDYIMHGGPELYEQVTHIPLIIKEPGQTQGRVINDVVEQVDIPATILEFAKVNVPSWMEGRSLVPLMKGGMLSPRPAFSMNFEKNPSRGHQITKGTVAVWEGDYKLIHYLEEKKSLLFNLKQDPDELNNLLDRESEVGQRLLALIQDNLKKANEKIRWGE